MREKLAELCHEQWSGWMRYLFSKCGRYSDGRDITPDEDAVIPQWAVERWQRQMQTPYADLSEEEKDSDRKEADKFLALFNSRAVPIPPQMEQALDALEHVRQENERLRELLKK